MNDDMSQFAEEIIRSEEIEQGSRITTIVSGGMDSITMLYLALTKTTPDKVVALSFNYGQKHSKELQQAKFIAEGLGVKHNVIDLQSASDLLVSSLTKEEKEVPHGHYAEETMRATVVPNRNAIMLSIAYGVALSNGSKYLLYGAHTGDHFIYPDCRPEFVDALDNAFKIGNKGFGDTSIVAPFREVSKSIIASVGLKLSVPYERTWSCYEGQDRPCLHCGTCVERTEAFLDNESKDPLLTDAEWAEAVAFHAQATEEYKKTHQQQ